MSENKENSILNNYFGKLSIEELIQPVKNAEQVIQIINSVEKLMSNYAEKITYTQMRNIYSIIRDEKEVADLHKKRPRIAYILARQDKEEARNLVEFIIEIMKSVKETDEVKEFKEFMETMVAYHKLYAKNKN